LAFKLGAGFVHVKGASGTPQITELVDRTIGVCFSIEAGPRPERSQGLDFPL
jgi:hypothetical protein